MNFISLNAEPTTVTLAEAPSSSRLVLRAFMRRNGRWWLERAVRDQRLVLRNQFIVSIEVQQVGRDLYENSAVGGRPVVTNRREDRISDLARSAPAVVLDPRGAIDQGHGRRRNSASPF